MPLTEYTFNVENAVDRIFFGRTTIKKANSFLFFVENGIVKNLLHHLKYRNQEQIGTFLGDWHGQIIAKNNFIDKIDYVIPVPLHHKKLKRRGYNQVSLFGKQLALHLKAEFLENGLIKTSNTKTQTKKTRIGRWQNNKALYMLNKPELITNKNILLVDDVITTGATMEICAQTLGEAKGVTIFITSMAVVPLT
ncbi:putative amidophosphoribosyl-transferase [Maribacter sp. HTCC2170]|nr:putative amidophosphoribosyl-transferase [Maribacter sp. HTCC2170]